MKSIIKVHPMNSQRDVIKIQHTISQIEGIIACEVSLERKEVNIIYNESFLDIQIVIENIENIGYMVI